ncbi:hypothetical protein CLOLEP_01645 [[Clostridium] leptum DSM 753]|uniref:Uncharacterized protein n=1 Tax=[Clostridium] leptum DSM 753 TaxID=428125 RepID=A7VSV4_9FIRM|nr:hypothetical protein CLOLEP_01645 [[Clostridium] leptum DSM 753]
MQKPKLEFSFIACCCFVLGKRLKISRFHGKITFV